jgi:hypothetical protein
VRLQHSLSKVAQRRIHLKLEMSGQQKHDLAANVLL